MTLQGVKQNPDFLRDDLRRMSASINQLIGQGNQQFIEFTITETPITSDITLNDTHTVVTVDASSAAVTLTLPIAANVSGRYYVIKKIDSSANNVIIDANGSETIDGALTNIISAQYDSVSVISDASQWWII